MLNLLKRSAPWIELVGIFVLLAGLGLDAVLHRRDAALAAREGIFTLSNPGHLLFAFGIGIIVLGAIFFLVSRALYGKFSLPRFALWGGLTALLVACSLVSFSLAASTEGALGVHSHSPDKVSPGTAAGVHLHESGGPDQRTHQHLESGAHIQWAVAHPSTAADIARANAVKLAAQQATARYQDVHLAEQDGYKMFGPRDRNQSEYHFSKTWNSIRAVFTFEPTQPTSLLYRQDADGKFVLDGVMYLAPAFSNESQLDKRYPVNLGQWHKHINICLAPKGTDIPAVYLAPNAKFGPRGTITTQSDCQAANGNFKTALFGWMVHIYFSE